MSRLDKRQFALAILAGLVALTVFALDTATNFEIAVSVLYVAVVLLAVRFLDVRGVLAVAGACIVLAILSHVATRQGPLYVPVLVNLIIGIIAIVIATYLALQNESAHKAIHEQALLLDLTHDTILVRNMDDVITYRNRGAEERYGWTKDQALGKSTHKLLQTRFPKPFDEIMRELKHTGRWEGELSHVKRDGTLTFVASRWSLLKDERGRPIAILETNNDITKQKEIEKNLHTVEAALAHVARTATLGEFAASIAHEVNQPLATIVTNGEICLRLIDRDSPDLQEIRDAIEGVVSNSMRASEIIRRLRSLSNKSEPHKTLLDINDVIREIVPLVERELLVHGVSLALELDPEIAPVLGDRVQLQQVILNLVANGMEAINAVGKGPGRLLITTYNDSDQVVVAVRDSGTGIDPDAEKQLFNTFFTTKADGMGMGLAICRSIIELHEGRIWAKDNVEGGATFQFSLPAAQGTPKS